MRNELEIKRAKNEMAEAFERWNQVSVISDPRWEEVAWAEFWAKSQRYQALISEKKKELQLTK